MFYLCKKVWKRIANLLLKKYQEKDGIAEMNSAYQGTYESVYKYPPIEKSDICLQLNPQCELKPTECGFYIECTTLDDIANGARHFEYFQPYALLYQNRLTNGVSR